MRFFAVSAAEGVFQSKLGWEGWGRESFFIFWKAVSWRVSGRLKALAMEA